MFTDINVDEFEDVLSEKKYDIGYGHKGNGITVWNKSEKEHGDYKVIAHIDSSRKISYKDSKLPPDIKKQIEKISKSKQESFCYSKGWCI